MIVLRNVSKKYWMHGKEIQALCDVSLTINKQDFVVVMGKSGSGKSTLLQILGCLQKPDGGDYWFEGVNVYGLSLKEQDRFRNQKIGFIFQQFHLISYLTAYENLRIPMIYSGQGVDERRMEQFLKAFRLWKWKDHLPNELSGGQQQRVCIARALIQFPQLILCDEPTGALDEQSSEQVVQILKLLNKHGATIVMVTHDLRYRNLGNRLFCVDEGCVKEWNN